MPTAEAFIIVFSVVVTAWFVQEARRLLGDEQDYGALSLETFFRLNGHAVFVVFTWMAAGVALWRAMLP